MRCRSAGAAKAVKGCSRQGRPLLARTASPLAALLAGTVPQSLHGEPLARHQRVLAVCGSHTEGATRQLAALGGRIVELPTDLAFESVGRPELLAGLVTLTCRRLEGDGFAILATERTRRTQHARLRDGAVVMDALVAVTRRLIAHCDALAAKGGITSADLARRAAGAATAHVLGQVETGVPVWRLHTPDHLCLTCVTHWTVSSPGYSGSYNCKKDQAACDYLHAMAADGKIKLTEIGAAGQRFVDLANDDCGAGTVIPDHGLGTYVNVTKHTGTPDFSDGSTFLLMVTGGLSGYTRDGSAAGNFDKAYHQLCSNASAVFDHFRANL